VPGKSSQNSKKAFADYWTPATPTDIPRLMFAMRDSDIEEAAFVRSRVPSPSLPSQLLDVVERHRAWGLWEGGRLVGLGGSMPFPQAKSGSIWFLGTVLADDRPLFVTKACVELIRFHHQEFAYLGNWVPAQMTGRIRWLEMLGFDMDWQSEHVVQHGMLPFWRHSSRPEHRPAARKEPPAFRLV
jgi:hypothetical protein